VVGLILAVSLLEQPGATVVAEPLVDLARGFVKPR